MSGGAGSAYTVLRTAAGSPVAPSVLEVLRTAEGVRVVAVDSEPHACGFSFAEASYVVPRVDDPAFIERMLEICRSESVDLMIPDLDEELLILASATDDFERAGTRILVSPTAALRICTDKYLTYLFLRDLNVPTPRSFLPASDGDDRALPCPAWVKPRAGRGGRGGGRVDDRETLARRLAAIDEPIVQELVDGTEYTIDTLSDLSGRFLYCSVRERIATESGISVRGRTVTHGAIETYTERIVSSLGLVGPACVQCFETSSGDLRFIEVNPRIGGGAILSQAAGAPIITDALLLARGEPIVGRRDYRAGLLMVRHWAELYADERGPVLLR